MAGVQTPIRGALVIFLGEPPKLEKLREFYIYNRNWENPNFCGALDRNCDIPDEIIGRKLIKSIIRNISAIDDSNLELMKLQISK